MGLSVSQIRLLALTNRKADIELQVQLNSKRKQMLSRQTTELAQQYYNRLQNSTIQYATTNGYEDVNYNYLMGETKDAVYTADFLQAIATNDKEYTALKSDNNMILVNQYGEVIANDTIAQVVTETKTTFAGQDMLTKTAQGIMQLISDGYHNSSGSSGSPAIKTLYDLIKNSAGNVDPAKRAKYANYVKAFISNGGFQDKGNLYLDAVNNLYFRSAQEAKESETNGGNNAGAIKPENGYAYAVYSSSGSVIQSTQLYYNDGTASPWTGISKDTAILLGNLTNYFAPIISSAMQNGMSANVTSTAVYPQTTYAINYTTNTYMIVANPDGTTGSDVLHIAGQSVYSASLTPNQITSNARSHFSGSACCVVLPDSSGQNHYLKSAGGGSTSLNYIDSGSLAGNFYSYTYSTTGRGNFDAARNTDALQAGLKSGTYQLCMVDDVARGSYKKNTTLSYFVNKSLVVDRTDSSKKEEITAWFNAEQAKLSEKETYWDTEIQNLSTELNSVNTEIESVKTMKSNAIKSVFNWGGS